MNGWRWFGGRWTNGVEERLCRVQRAALFQMHVHLAAFWMAVVVRERVAERTHVRWWFGVKWAEKQAGLRQTHKRRRRRRGTP